MSSFVQVAPSLENHWRAVILFGRNVASYKFALGRSLLELSQAGRDRVTLQELAEPYSRHLTEHLRLADKQATSTSSRCLVQTVQDDRQGRSWGQVVGDRGLFLQPCLRFEDAL